MKPKKFKGHNVVFAENQPEYMPLPAFKNDSVQGEVVTCWKLSFKERMLLLIKGEIWLSQMTFNRLLQPVLLSVEKSDVLQEIK